MSSAARTWKHPFLWSLLVASLTLFGQPRLYAGVNERNLNFYRGYTLLEVPGYMPLKVTLAYNTYGEANSTLGKGWKLGAVKLSVKGRGPVVLEADGFANTYSPEQNKSDRVDSECVSLIRARRMADLLVGGKLDDSDYAKAEQQFREDTSFREASIVSLFAGVPLKPGNYYSVDRGRSTVERLADGSYLRGFDDGSKDTFNSDGSIRTSRDRYGNQVSFTYERGELVRQDNNDGAWVAYRYSENPMHLIAVADSLGRQVTFAYDSESHLSEIHWPDGGSARFEYNSIGLMSRLAERLVDKDSGRLRDSERFATIAYNSRAEVSSTTEGDTKREFRRVPVEVVDGREVEAAGEPKSRWRTYVEILKNGELISREIRDYGTQRDVIRKLSIKEASKTVTIKSPVNGEPELEDEDGKITRYEYDSTGRLTHKIMPENDQFYYRYRRDTTLIEMIRHVSAAGEEEQTNYTYDDRNDLVQTERIRGGDRLARLVLVWSERGKLKEVSGTKDGLSGTVRFTYCSFGKPDSITLLDCGTLNVIYRNDGEIDKVNTIKIGAGNQLSNGEVVTKIKRIYESFQEELRPSGMNF